MFSYNSVFKNLDKVTKKILNIKILMNKKLITPTAWLEVRGKSGERHRVEDTMPMQSVGDAPVVVNPALSIGDA